MDNDRLWNFKLKPFILNMQHRADMMNNQYTGAFPNAPNGGKYEEGICKGEDADCLNPEKAKPMTSHDNQPCLDGTDGHNCAGISTTGLASLSECQIGADKEAFAKAIGED